jgi:tetratricopeptide (TPR) repeat protein
MPNPDDGSGNADGANNNTDAIDQYRILLRLQILLAIGCLLIFLYALHFRGSHEVLRIFGVGILVAAAALMAGFLLGFVFGIPSLSPKMPGPQPSTEEGGSPIVSSGQPSNSVRSNTNLIEISDWLTKIIVGVGLVELSKIPAKLGELSYYVGIGLRPAQCDGHTACFDSAVSGQAAALAIMIFYFAAGFLFGYIWTRLHFEKDLENQLRKLQEYKKVTDSILSAEAFVNEGKLDEALKEINKAIKKNRRDGRAILTKGRILKRQAMEPGVAEADKTRLLNQALDFANQAIALLPGKAEPIYNKACYQALLGLEKDQILANLSSAFRLNPGLRRTASGDPDRARFAQDTDFRQLVDVGPQANG